MHHDADEPATRSQLSSGNLLVSFQIHTSHSQLEVPNLICVWGPTHTLVDGRTPAVQFCASNEPKALTKNKFGII